MTRDNVLALLARVPVCYWPVLVISLFRIAGEIEAAYRQGLSGWICYDRCGRVWLELYPPATPGVWDHLRETLAPARRMLACALAASLPAPRPVFTLHCTPLPAINPDASAPDLADTS